MSRTNNGVPVWSRADTVPTDAEGGYAGGDGVAALLAGIDARSTTAWQTVDNLKVTATTLPAGSPATVKISGSLPNKIIEIGIPKGRDGEPGMGYAQGQQILAAAQAAQESVRDIQDVAFGSTDTQVSQIVSNPVTDTYAILSSSFARVNEFSGLLPWRVAYNNRGAQQAKVVVLGSNEGQGATSPANVWTNILEGALADQRYSDYIPAIGTDSSNPNSELTFTGTVERSTDGFGRIAVLKGADTDARKATANLSSRYMTRVTVWYTRNDFFSCPAEVYVDNTLVGTIGTGSFLAAQKAVYEVTPGNHTVRIKAAGGASQGFLLQGVELGMGSSIAPGLTVYDGTRKGWRLRDTSGSSYDSKVNPMITAVQPDLVVLYAGDKDWLDDAYAFSENPIRDIVTKYTGLIAKPFSLLFVLPPRPVPPSGSTVDPAMYAWARSLLLDITSVNPYRVAFFDMGAYWPRLQADGATNTGLMLESTYPVTPSDAGHRHLALTLADLLR